MAERDYTISLAGYRFDPLRERLPVPPDMREDAPADRPSYYLVQFHRSLDRDDRERIQGRHGLRLDEYVPRLAYLEKLSPRQLAALSSDPTFRAAVPFQPGFKISPGIGRLVFRTEERQQMEGLLLRAILFPEADPDEAVRALEEAGASDIKAADDRPVGGALQIVFAFPSQERLPALARIEQVRWIEEVPELLEDNANTAGTMQSGTPGTEPIWDQGLHGEGQIIGVIDSPIDLDHCWFRDDVNNTPNPAHRKVIGFRNDAGQDPGSHGTFVAGIVAGDDVDNPGTDPNRGNAWAARLTYGNDDDVRGGGESFLAYLIAAQADGAAIHTNSWHEEPDPQYSQHAADADTFVWNNEDNLILGSSGNVGEAIGPPGTAKNAICVSAAQVDPNEMNFGDGNTGPTSDDRPRRKPDLFAPGCSITSSDVDTACGTTMSGCATSWATPAAAAAATLVRQYYIEGWYPTGTQQPHHAFIPSGALIKATLLNSTIDMTGMAGYPGDMEGWGLIRLNNVLFFPASPRNLRVWDTRNADGLLTGQSRDHHVDVASSGQPLKVTLVWSDPPASAGATDPVVNDLDLVVTSPDGTQTFPGNNFAGGVSTTGSAADDRNNVEMVLVNAPMPGDWTIVVNGTEVNVGNPGQGYALVVTADLTEAPSPLGNQDTLVVRVKFADIAFEPPLPNLQNKMLNAAEYMDEVSYGQTTVTPVFRGPIDLDHPKDYYYHPSRNLLIELTEEVVAKLLAADPTVFDRGTLDPSDDIDRMVIVTNDVNFTEDWATTGPWPYDMPGGFTRPISVSIQSYANPAARFTHGLCHQFNLVDLYAHPGVVFPRPYVDEWDNMAGLFTNIHPLVWSKERAGWITGHGSQIHYIPRPAAGSTYTGMNPIPLFLQESTATNRKAIAIGLTEGAASIEDEKTFYFIEARDNTLGGFDDALPGSGVLIYYVNTIIPQGQGPVILQDKNLLTMTLADAPFGVADSRTIPGTGLTITVQAGTGRADYNIHVDYEPPITDYNVYITKGDTIEGEFYPWFSPDIWIDSPQDGYNLGAGPPPHEDREHPVVDAVNRIYARVHNAGPGTAFDFDVRFRISEPYHTVGGQADFDQFIGIKHISSLGPGETNVFVEWTPTGGEDPHSCVLVDLINLVGTDTNPHDNQAQENLEEVTSVTSSPYHPVTYSYNLTNPYDQPALFYFRAEGAPPTWALTLNPRKILLGPGERMTGQLTVEPPERAEVCTSERIQVTSWTPRGDTLIPVGGGVVQVNLRRPTVLTLDVGEEQCKGDDIQWLLEEAKKRGGPFDPEQLRKRCHRITAQGCTDPAIPNQEIVVKFVDPYGNPVYHTVMTDKNGCFEDFLVTAEEGNWEVTAEYPGDKCQAPTRGGPTVVCVCR